MAKAADIYFQVDPWKIIEDGFDPSYSRVSESIFSLANETMGIRGCFDEGGSVDSLRGAYTNGVYDFAPVARSYRGIIDHTHFMIPTADWLITAISLDGETLDLGKAEFSDFRRILDMRAGTLTRSFVWKTVSGKELRLTFIRFLDMVHRECAYQRITLEALNFSGKVNFSSGLSFDVWHEGNKKCFWGDTRAEAEGNRLLLQSRTLTSGQEVFAGAQLSLTGADISLNAPLSFNTCIKAGDVYVSDMFNLYRYENQLYMLRMTGEEVRKHLEMSYDQWVNTMKSPDDHIMLLNDGKTDDKQRFMFKNLAFNFDSAAGIDYEVDVTKPDGQKVRILRMSNGEPFDEHKWYNVAMNSYRGNGGGELVTRGAGIPLEELPKRIIFQTEKDQRFYLMKEIEKAGRLNPQPNNNWRFVPEEWTKPAIERDRKLLFGSGGTD